MQVIFMLLTIGNWQILLTLHANRQASLIYKTITFRRKAMETADNSRETNISIKVIYFWLRLSSFGRKIMRFKILNAIFISSMFSKLLTLKFPLSAIHMSLFILFMTKTYLVPTTMVNFYIWWTWIVTTVIVFICFNYIFSRIANTIFLSIVLQCFCGWDKLFIFHGMWGKIEWGMGNVEIGVQTIQFRERNAY